MLNMKLPPFSEFRTTRLVLRKLITEDKEELFRLRSNNLVNQYIDRPKIQTEDECRAFIEKINLCIERKESYYWAIARKNEDRLIGTICLWNISAEDNSAEIGFELHPDHQRQGLMHEAVAEILAFGFGCIQLQRMEAWINMKNETSIKLVGKYKFFRNKKLEEKYKELPELKTMFIYSMEHP